VAEGENLAVVGESGSGKTTLARCLLRLVEPTAGEVWFRGVDVLTMTASELLDFRRKAQIVFQDPFGSLNPRLRAGPMLEEVLRVHREAESPEKRRARVDQLLDLVGLHHSHYDRYPHEFSGGQRQRLGIARALSVEPQLLVLDEPVSALDLSVQAQILNLLKNLQETLSLTLILVAHDLAVVRHVADRVAVMKEGRIVELAPTPDLFEAPSHQYSRRLLEAAGWRQRNGG
jgi:ABC-type glutathione transport system ATPase component